MKTIIFNKTIFLAMFALSAFAAHAETYTVKSPNGNIEASVKDGAQLMLSVSAYGQNVLPESQIGISTSRGEMGANAKPLNVRKSSEDSVIDSVIGTRSSVRDRYNQIILDFGKYALVLRAYDEGAAYRFVSKLGAKEEMTVDAETMSLNLPSDTRVFAHVVGGDNTCFEEGYRRTAVGDLKGSHSATLPFIYERDGMKIAVLESDVWEYPMLRLNFKDGAPKAYFAKYPKRNGFDGRLITVEDTEDFIAKTLGRRELPWRIFVVARDDAELADCDIVYKLARPSKLADSSWVKPGQSVWEWWSALNLEGVDFRSGMNIETYKYIIDFAAKHGIAYVIMDEGWLDFGQLPDGEAILNGRLRVDVPAIIKYAAEKNVKVILWAFGRFFNENAAEAMDLMKSWGATGIKADIFDRDDQQAVELYEKIARLAAERQMIVDFHGCPRPAGLQRTYPNAINFEGVRGGEYNKATDWLTPSHNVDLIFTRMLQGPMDYTPGATNNTDNAGFKAVDTWPMALGTRSHQAAMFVLHNAPLMVLCDSVTQYERNEPFVKFVAQIPTAWDDTKVLAGQIGEYVVIARRKGDVWYIGGLTNWTKRDFQIDLDFLPDGEYEVEMLADSVNSDKLYRDYKVDSFALENRVLPVKMSHAGGFAAKISKKK